MKKTVKLQIFVHNIFFYIMLQKDCRNHQSDDQGCDFRDVLNDNEESLNNEEDNKI